ncbi:MAG: hypothetical protein ACRDUB_19325 [Mycobacterium sp.]
MTSPECPTPRERSGVAAESEVPDCGTGPLGRLRFVARELAALWRHRRSAEEK